MPLDGKIHLAMPSLPTALQHDISPAIGKSTRQTVEQRSLHSCHGLFSGRHTLELQIRVTSGDQIRIFRAIMFFWWQTHSQAADQANIICQIRIFRATGVIGTAGIHCRGCVHDWNGEELRPCCHGSICTLAVPLTRPGLPS